MKIFFDNLRETMSVNISSDSDHSRRRGLVTRRMNYDENKG